MTVGLPVPPGFVSTATITTTTAATAAAATSDKDVSGGGSKGNSGDQGLSPAAVVGISIAIHIVVTIILVLFVRAYRNKYKRLKKAQQQQQAAVLGERRRGGACGRQPPVKKRASPQKWFKRVSNHHSGNRMTQDTTWIKLQDNVAATSSDAWSSPREARHSASDRTPSPRRPRHHPEPEHQQQQQYRYCAEWRHPSSARRTQHQQPHWSRAAATELPHQSKLGYLQFLRQSGESSKWRRCQRGAARTLDGLERRALERGAVPDPTGAAAVGDRVLVPSVRPIAGGGEGGPPSSYYGDDEDDNNNIHLPPSTAEASAAQSLRQMHSRRRLVERGNIINDNNNNNGDGDQEEEVIQIGHRPEDLSSNQTMVVREAVPPPLRPSTRPRPPLPPEAFQSHWSLSS
ncbi:hypothetical protein PG988_001826 [Apiospora saccharicola]